MELGTVPSLYLGTDTNMELGPALCVYGAVKALSSSAETSFDRVMLRSAR